MMSQGNLCRLCAEIYQDYKSLYDESGKPNEVQQLMMQYFDENLLHTVTGNNCNVMCMKCWHTIADFNSFQQSIYRTQRILRLKVEEIDIKSEEEFLPEDDIVGSNCEKPTDILAEEEAPLTRCDIEIVCVSSADDSSNIDDSAEYDGPVETFMGGKVGNESNSSELLVGTELIAECNEALKIKDRLTKSIPQKVNLRKKINKSLKASDDVIAQWLPVLQCLFCTETFSTYSLLQRHFYDKHRPLECQVKCCSIYFHRRDKFEDHIRVHIDPSAFDCTFCGMKKMSRGSLAYHIREHHHVSNDATISPRNDSNAVSSSPATITEISTKSIPNNIGKWKFGQGKVYIKECDDFIAEIKPTLNCYLCTEKYTTFSLFRQHFSEIHPGKKLYITCCKRKLISRFRILEHLQLHANPDVFKCKLCEVRCNRRDSLKSHMQLHANPDAFTCKLCEVRCTRRYRLKLHMRMHHTSTTSIKKKEKISIIRNRKTDDLLAKWLPSRECALCKKAFGTLTKLQCHFLECHPSEKFYVECCERKLMTRPKIVAHVQYHVNCTDFKCDLCCICFSQKRHLETHMRNAH